MSAFLLGFDDRRIDLRLQRNRQNETLDVTLEFQYQRYLTEYGLFGATVNGEAKMYSVKCRC